MLKRLTSDIPLPVRVASGIEFTIRNFIGKAHARALFIYLAGYRNAIENQLDVLPATASLF